MTLPDEVDRLLPQLTRGEKAELLQRLARDLGDASPGIDANPDVLGGEPCIVRTRIPVWTLVQARKLRLSEGQILQAYPSLRAEDLTNAWAYYRAHHDEIEEQIRANEAA